MWFEILPGFAIIVASVAAPHGLAYILNYLVVGNCYRRLLETDKQRLQYLRDRRLTDNPYKVNGLECIPDDESEETEEGSKEESQGDKKKRSGDGAAENGFPVATEKATELEDEAVSVEANENEGRKRKC